VQQLAALHIFQGHLGVVEDVAWHPRHGDLFGSVGDDKKLIIWDLRKPQPAAQDKEVEAHTGAWVGGLRGLRGIRDQSARLGPAWLGGAFLLTQRMMAVACTLCCFKLTRCYAH
jgi:WD40 repeat protein